ncbi:MAG TPA: hypothetical protein VGJ72_15625 [Polaromonas sp.]
MNTKNLLTVDWKLSGKGRSLKDRPGRKKALRAVIYYIFNSKLWPVYKGYRSFLPACSLQAAPPTVTNQGGRFRESQTPTRRRQAGFQPTLQTITTAQ